MDSDAVDLIRGAGGDARLQALGVGVSTLRRWRASGLPRGLSRVALLALGGDLSMLGPAWSGWRAAQRPEAALVAPSGEVFPLAWLLALPLLFERFREERLQLRQSSGDVRPGPPSLRIVRLPPRA